MLHHLGLTDIEAFWRLPEASQRYWWAYFEMPDFDWSR